MLGVFAACAATLAPGGWAFFATGLVLILAVLPWLRLRGIAT